MEQELKVNNRAEKTEIELWDCSGDLKYLFFFIILISAKDF